MLTVNIVHSLIEQVNRPEVIIPSADMEEVETLIPVYLSFAKRSCQVQKGLTSRNHAGKNFC